MTAKPINESTLLFVIKLLKADVLDGKTVIFVHVNEAPESMKPVHIGDKLENSWIRTGDGDRKITKEELAAFLRNAQPGEDSLVIDGFSIADLDMDSVISYKERVNKRFPKKNYLEMPNEEFLVEIGAYSLKVWPKEPEVREAVPHLFVSVTRALSKNTPLLSPARSMPVFSRMPNRWTYL